MRFNNTLTTLIKKHIASNTIPMLLGEPGIGKSSFLEAIASELRTQCFTLACNQLADKADLTGARLVPHEVDKKLPDGTVVKETVYSQVFYPHKVITDAIIYAENHPRETPILFLDELNRTTPDVTSELLSIPTSRSIGNTKLPDNLRIVAAGNDKGNVTSLDKASVSRFVLISVEPDAQTFLSIHPDLNPFIQKVLAAHPETIYGVTTVLATDPQPKQDDDDDDNAIIEEILDEGDDMSQITTPRTIAALSRWLNTFDKTELMAIIAETHKNASGQDVSVLQELIEGFVGHTLFSALLLTEIAGSIMTVNNVTGNMTVTKPSSYDAMKACADVTQLSIMIANMDEKERSGCLLYSVYEKADNTIYIQTLADNTNHLEKDDLLTLMTLSNANDLDSENLQTLLTTNGELAKKLNIVLSI